MPTNADIEIGSWVILAGVVFFVLTSAVVFVCAGIQRAGQEIAKRTTKRGPR